ncbi:putative mitochondrial protein [Dendrobium catenatum]|uniref:Putative mitochondrial protein n=1 Tax=Dendrobium catenatum TaxID=906689 RepID=A0A2I0VNE2_9ASPA|nr:putative mitochondrial protein [Dendrobium catenatum]
MNREDLHEVGHVGPKYTWCNNKIGGGRILERLDRCLLNCATLNLIQMAVVKHLARIVSDHCSISINILANKAMNKRSIMFEDTWLTYKASHSVVQASWNKKCFIKGRSISDQILLAQELFNKFRHSKAKKGLVSIKIDMEKAYDSMCWATLEKVMDSFGFPKAFSKLILECVVSPKFSILINGESSKWIEAECGFRQGCPLSPYLFIMCSQLLMEEFENIGKNIGIKVNPNGPIISHLMYADDIMIFSRANKNCMKKVDNILKNYCSWTG